MEKRRVFLKMILGFLSGIGVLFNPLFPLANFLYARTKRAILPKGTKRESLVNKDPGQLDTRNLEITPLKEFGIMGLSDHEVDLDDWNLRVTGHVQRPLSLSYREILTLPATEKDVLLICPGVFSNHGRWKGISMEALLRKAEMEKEPTHVTFAGPDGQYEKTERFPMEEVLSGKVFLAYGVNGETLLKKHGFPLRIVAEDHYGNEWVKYVWKATVEKV